MGNSGSNRLGDWHPGKRWNQSMVRSKRSDHEEGISNEQLEAYRHPQHLPVWSSACLRAFAGTDLRRAHQFVKRRLQGFEPADRQQLAVVSQGLSQPGKDKFLLEPMDICRIEDALGKI